MSFNKYTVPQIATFFTVQKHTVYAWLNRWEKGGLMGLHDKPGRGRKPLISLENKQHAKIVDEAVQNAFEKGTDIQEEIGSKTQLTESFSKRTLRRLLKKRRCVWKRLRRQTKKHPPKQEKADLIEALSWAVNLAVPDYIDLFFVYELGFSWQPSIAYAWQPKGVPWAIESSKSKRINVLGFLNPIKAHLVTYTLPDQTYMDSDLLISDVED